MKFAYQISLLVIVCIACLVTQANASNCTGDSCLFGRCLSNGTCLCDSGYVTFGSNGLNCNYQQKEKLTAFLLSFFIGSTGADWFYLARGNESMISYYVFFSFE